MELTLTRNSDPQLQALTKRIQNEIEGPTGWFRLGELMIGMAKVDKAKQVPDIMLARMIEERGKGPIYYQLGWVKNEQEEHSETLSYYEKALEIRQKTLPANHSTLAISYNNIVFLYSGRKDYARALSYFELDKNTWKHLLPPNHPNLNNVERKL